MSAPPTQLRKGFDHKLAYALQTTREILLKGWQSTPAEKAERVTLHADQLPLVEEDSWNPALADLWRKIIPYLAPSELEWLLLQAALKVLEKRDSRAEIFRPILDRFKIFEHYQKTGERLPTPPPGKSPVPHTRPAPLPPGYLPGETDDAYLSRIVAQMNAIGVKHFPEQQPPPSSIVGGPGVFMLPPDPPAPPPVATTRNRPPPPRHPSPKKSG